MRLTGFHCRAAFELETLLGAPDADSSLPANSPLSQAAMNSSLFPRFRLSW
jgi:hypothetical protein